jgi:adhesin HecA-like repeat protein
MARTMHKLVKPENWVWLAAGTGALVDLRTGVPDLDDPAGGASWGAARTVPAELLVELLVGARTPLRARRLQAVRVRGARITGRLNLEAATLACPLLLQDCYLEQSISLNQARAQVILLPGCHLPGLTAEQLETRGNLVLDRSSVTGEVRLLGAHIGGQLRFNGASLTNPDGPALNADEITVGQGVFCLEGFAAAGEVRMIGAHIGGTLELDGATLTNPNGQALNADRLTVDQGMFCRKGFTSEGEVRLLGGHIGGTVEFDGATLTNPNGRALNAKWLTVDQNMHCREGFIAAGEACLLDAHISGQLQFTGASLTNPGKLVLHMEGVQTAGLFLLPAKRPDGTVSLTNARIGSFHDDQESWPARLRLRGFVYDTLENDQVSVRARVRWLRRHEGGYTPQVYEQLAAAYRRDGRDEEARRVLIAKQWRRRGWLNPWNWLLYATVGYGYRTWLAGLWLLILLGVGTRALDQAYQVQLLAPANDQPSQQPTFHPLTFALDLLLPIVNLGQEGAWIARGWAERWTWGLVLAGWVLTTAVVAGLTGVLNRD